MRYFLIRSISFIIIGVIIISSIIYASSKMKYDDKYTIVDQVTQNPVKKGGATLLKFYEAKHVNKSVDILVIGTSRAFRAFDPKVFEAAGLNIHILATSSQTPLNTYYMLKDYLNVVKPKLVIFEIHLGLLNNNGLESFYDLSANLPVSWNLFEMAVAIDLPSAYTVFISGMINQINESIYNDFKYQIPKWYYKGFNIDYKHDTTLIALNIDDRFIESVIKNKAVTNFEYIEKTIKYALDNDTQIVLALMPALIKQPLAHYNRISQIAEKFKITFYDLNKILNNFNPKSDFYDRSHLNSNGAVKVSEFMIGELQKQDIINMEKN